MTSPRVAFAAALKRDLVQQAAYPLLVLRVIEGLAAWVLFTEVFLPYGRHPHAWVVHLAFLWYFASNLYFTSAYHAGRILIRFVVADVCSNLVPLVLVSAASGGFASPVGLVVLLKVLSYAFVFGVPCGVLSMLVGAASAALGVAAHLLGVWVIVPLAVLPPAVASSIDLLVRGLVLVTASAGAMYFVRHSRRKEDQIGREIARAREAAERQRAAASVASALLAVSDAISRLTRLDDILAKVVEIVPGVLSVDYCSLFLWRADDGVYVGAAAAGLERDIADRFTAMRLRPEEAPDLEWVRYLGHCAMVSPGPTQALGVPAVPTVLIAPLLSGGQFFGVMQLARRRGGGPFTQGDLQLADGVARQTGVALERARLVEESRRLVRAVESTGEAVLITDARQRIRFVNNAFLRTFGYEREELIGHDAALLTDRLSPDWLTQVTHEITAQGWRGEAAARRRDGREFPVMLNASLIRDDLGRVVGAVAILEDISEQKRLEEQLRRADRLAASGEMAAGIAHEVNNALVGILVQAELADTGASADDLRTALRRVEGQGRRIASIVQALLGFARPQAPRREPVALPSLVAETLALLDHDLRRHAVRLTMLFPPSLPPVLADARQIEQVLVNLFTNAIQAMGGGGGSLAVRAAVEQDRVRLDVTDTGPGIAPAHLARIFDPFFTTKPEGSGLGLSVSYGIMRAHDGDLTVHSEVGRGTTFSLVLPAAPRAAIDGLHRALVVDDEDDVADALKKMLADEGVSAERAATGEEAIRRLMSEPFDVVLLDVRLPDISGTEVFARLQAERPEVASQVVFVTGGLWRGESRLRAELPAQPTLSKPCTRIQLRDALAALSARRAA
jgi:PAS domain S-box-containing protein